MPAGHWRIECSPCTLARQHVGRELRVAAWRFEPNASPMNRSARRCRLSVAMLLLAIALGSSGCQQMLRSQPHRLPPTGFAASPAPRELNKAILPEYRIEPPDVLVVDNVHVVPGAGYRLRTLDTMAIAVEGTLPEDPIHGVLPSRTGWNGQSGRRIWPGQGDRKDCRRGPGGDPQAPAAVPQGTRRQSRVGHHRHHRTDRRSTPGRRRTAWSRSAVTAASRWWA